MITNPQELILSLNEAWLSKPLTTREQTKVRVYLSGGYVIDHVYVDEDGTLSIWLDERGEDNAPG